MSESYTDIYDPYYYPQPVYTQAELIDMVRATLQRKFNADYSFQTHVQGDYSVNTETFFDEETKKLSDSSYCEIIQRKTYINNRY